MNTLDRGRIFLAPNHGAQDEYLYVPTGRTLFKEDLAEMQHPPFGSETRVYRFGTDPDGTLNPATGSSEIFGTSYTCAIPVDDADLLGNVVLEVTLPPLRQQVSVRTSWGTSVETSYVRWAQGGVTALIERVEFLVGGYVLQQQSGRVIDAESLMRVPPAARHGYDRMTGRNRQHLGDREVTWYLPLAFFFCQSASTSTEREGDGRPMFPLCALRSGMAVELRVTLRPLVQCLNANHVVRHEDVTHARFVGADEPVRMRLWADLYVLDAAERLEYQERKVRHYLFEEIQEQEQLVEAGRTEVTCEITLNRSTKRLHWMLQDYADTFPNTLTGNRHFAYDGYSRLFLEANQNALNAQLYPPPIRTCQLMLGNLPREPKGLTECSWLRDNEQRVDGVYYTHLQPLMYQGCNAPVGRNYVFGYFFALRPMHFSPSGTYNLSVSTNHLRMRLNPNLRRTQLLLYSVGYNVLRVSEAGEVMVVFVE